MPYIKYFSFHFSLLFFLIFFNFFILKEIINEKTHLVIRYLYLFSFIFFNLSFNRLAEFGTDKAGQLLIVILTIKIFHQISYTNNKSKLNNIDFVTFVRFLYKSENIFFTLYLIGLTLILMNSK